MITYLTITPTRHAANTPDENRDRNELTQRAVVAARKLVAMAQAEEANQSEMTYGELWNTYFYNTGFYPEM